MKHFIIKYSLDACNHSEVISSSPFNRWRNGAERGRDLPKIPRGLGDGTRVFIVPFCLSQPLNQQILKYCHFRDKEILLYVRELSSSNYL